MLKSLQLQNLTVFADAKLEFSPGLNVLVGENGTGKTHALKAAYAGLYVSAQGDREGNAPTKHYLQQALAQKLSGVFKPDSLGRIARRVHGNKRCELSFTFFQPGCAFDFSFHTRSEVEVDVVRTPEKWLDKFPVYLPTRELLTIYPGFVSLYETTHLEFDESMRDTCVLLGAPTARGPRERLAKELLAPLESAMGGSLVLEKSGRFYLVTASGKLEMHLVAEGHRKFATLARLISTGSLLEKGCLLWDEPEANLNPRNVKAAAATILHLCKNGIQVMLATHSLFLLRELEILLSATEHRNIPARFFGLHLTSDGVEVQQGPRVEDIGDIASLDEELGQSQRYLEAEV